MGRNGCGRGCGCGCSCCFRGSSCVDGCCCGTLNCFYSSIVLHSTGLPSNFALELIPYLCTIFLRPFYTGPIQYILERTYRVQGANPPNNFLKKTGNTPPSPPSAQSKDSCLLIPAKILQRLSALGFLLTIYFLFPIMRISSFWFLERRARRGRSSA